MEVQGFSIESLEKRFEMQAIDPIGVISSLSPMASSAKVSGTCSVGVNTGTGATTVTCGVTVSSN